VTLSGILATILNPYSSLDTGWITVGKSTAVLVGFAVATVLLSVPLHILFNWIVVLINLFRGPPKVTEHTNVDGLVLNSGEWAKGISMDGSTTVTLNLPGGAQLNIGKAKGENVGVTAFYNIQDSDGDNRKWGDTAVLSPGSHITIGRASENNLHFPGGLKDELDPVGRFHLLIHLDTAGKLHIYDLFSTNSVKVRVNSPTGSWKKLSRVAAMADLKDETSAIKLILQDDTHKSAKIFSDLKDKLSELLENGGFNRADRKVAQRFLSIIEINLEALNNGEAETKLRLPDIDDAPTRPSGTLTTAPMRARAIQWLLGRGWTREQINRRGWRTEMLIGLYAAWHEREMVFNKFGYGFFRMHE
jgi:hypothetical protein